LLELRAIEIFKITFANARPEFIDRQVQYRYEKLVYELACKKLMLSEYKRHMHARNPLFLKSIDGKAPRSPKRE
jgi:hypothetical protein